MPTVWARYVREVTAGSSQGNIAKRIDVPQPTVSRWLKGRVIQPLPEHALRLARVYRRPPAEALAAAGYLGDGEVDLVAPPLIREYSDAELVAEFEHLTRELVARLLGRSCG